VLLSFGCSHSITNDQGWIFPYSKKKSPSATDPCGSLIGKTHYCFIHTQMRQGGSPFFRYSTPPFEIMAHSLLPPLLLLLLLPPPLLRLETVSSWVQKLWIQEKKK